MKNNLGDELTKEQEQYFKNSKVVDNQGNLLVCYHGTRQDRFTKFNPKAGFNVDAMYFTSVKSVASHWSGRYYPRLFNKKLVDDKLEKLHSIESNSTYDEWLKLALEILNKDLRYSTEINPTYENKPYGYYYRLDTFNGTSSSPLGYHDKQNPFIYFKFTYGHDGDDDYKQESNIATILYNLIDENMYQVYKSNGIYYVYINIENPLIVDAKKSTYYEIEFEGQITNTETISSIAKKRGYDGVIVKNVYETDYANILSDDYIVFDANQIKSIDNYTPTTSDDITETLVESLLLEKTRQQLISKGKTSDKYKDPKFAKLNRYTRRNLSKITTSIADYNRLDMNALFKGDLLDVDIKVHGETNDYVVTITIEHILNLIKENVKRNKNKLEFKCVYQALAQAFNNDDVYVKCTCPDWKYRQSYYATKDGYTTDFPEVRASNITNPHDTKGGGCKHIMLVLGNIDWIMKVSSVITNYIYYCKDNMEYNYARFIFPVIYGMDYDKAIQMTLQDYDKYGEPTDDLSSNPELLNLANAIGKKRTQFKKGNKYRFKKKDTKPQEQDNPLGLKFDNKQPQLKEPK